MNKKVHIVPYGEEWAVRTDGNTKVGAIFRTKIDAISAAQKTNHTKGSDLIIHCRDGRIKDSNNSKNGFYSSAY